MGRHVLACVQCAPDVAHWCRGLACGHMRPCIYAHLNNSNTPACKLSCRTAARLVLYRLDVHLQGFAEPCAMASRSTSQWLAGGAPPCFGTALLSRPRPVRQLSEYRLLKICRRGLKVWARGYFTLFGNMPL